MPYQTAAEVVRVTAGVAVRHGAPAADDGFVGMAIKTATPAADGVRANRDLIAIGEEYNLRTKGTIEVPTTNIADPDKGELVYIDPDDNAIAASQSGNNVVLGKITHLPGEQGTPADRVRVDLELKA